LNSPFIHSSSEADGDAPDREPVRSIGTRHYFPSDSVNKQYLRQSTMTSRCSWKGLANYYSLIIDGKTNEDAAWYYAAPSDAAAAIKGDIAFWKGVDVKVTD
jgi:uncharacterized protein (DUF427 family)